ncbi:unnamed protein product [Pleuronectes platessa]|uniref:Uncharacterized protein n=1 Tax=Pleuronectes platessa TaxID=8262 RepID=A0A9N7V612_PLEPL|nr:unnamed protein product [Pleuronectes platessa]
MRFGCEAVKMVEWRRRRREGGREKECGGKDSGPPKSAEDKCLHKASRLRDKAPGSLCLQASGDQYKLSTPSDHVASLLQLFNITRSTGVLVSEVSVSLWDPVQPVAVTHLLPVSAPSSGLNLPS